MSIETDSPTSDYHSITATFGLDTGGRRMTMESFLSLNYCMDKRPKRCDNDCIPLSPKFCTPSASPSSFSAFRPTYPQ